MVDPEEQWTQPAPCAIDQNERFLGKTHHLTVLNEYGTRRAGGASVTDSEALNRAIEGCEAVIHTAALHGHFRGKRDVTALPLEDPAGAQVELEAIFAGAMVAVTFYVNV